MPCGCGSTTSVAEFLPLIACIGGSKRPSFCLAARQRGRATELRARRMSLPPLQACRQAFDAYVAQPRVWEPEEGPERTQLTQLDERHVGTVYPIEKSTQSQLSQLSQLSKEKMREESCRGTPCALPSPLAIF